MTSGIIARACGTLYALLLRAYPRSFRRDWGDEMRADACRLIDDRIAARGWRGALQSFWILGRDVARSAPRERLRALRRRNPVPTTIPHRPAHRWSLAMLRHDFRHGLSLLARSPGFAVAAVLTAGLGIGATTAIFSVLHAVVLRPLPFPEPDRLVRIFEVTPQGQDFSTSPPNLLDFRERSRTLESVGAFATTRPTLTGGGQPERLDAGLVSPDVLTMLSAEPKLGRAFAREEEMPGNSRRIVILSEGFWQRRFGGDAEAVGASLDLDGESYEVVGVMPASFEFPGQPMIWLPMTLDPGAQRGDHRIRAIGRLRPGVTLAEAQADLASIAQELGRVYPESNGGWTVRLATFPDWIIGPQLTRTMLVLLLAAGLLLLMACANVGHLLLVRGLAREREMGVRAALGATRARIATQLLSESLVLALIAGAVGIALAYAGVPLLMRLSPPGLPRADEVAVDPTVLLFAAGVSVVTGLIFGLVPVLHLLRRDLHSALRAGARVDTSGGRRTREALLAAELALTTMLLIGASLLTTSFVRLAETDSGFDVENVLVVPIALTSRYYDGCPETGPGDCDGEMSGQRLRSFMTQVEERLEAVPGVSAVGATNITPLGGGSTGQEITIEGRTASGPSDSPWADWRAVTATFFDAADLPIVRGRAFTRAEDRADVRVVVVSEAMAKRFWPGEDPIGKRMAFGVNSDNWLTVVGVARDMRDTQLQNDPREIVFVPYSAVGWRSMTLLIRTHRRPATFADPVRQAIWSIDPALPLPDVRPFEGYRSDAVAGPRFSMLLMTVFASVALILGVLGVYGVTLFTVSRRVREFGVRLALGADRSAVVGMVLREALRPVVIGVALGVVAALFLSRLIEATLFGTKPIDPAVYAGVVLTLALIAFVASLVPALRATRIDPRVALASE